MAPALTEPISHRQSKISSPAQASSPRPIIGDISEQTATQNSNIAQNHLANQTNGSASDTYSSTKDTTSQLNDSQEKLVTIQTNQQPIEDFESDFIEQISNGPCLGPLFATHMDQSTNDQITTDYHQQQEQESNQQQNHQHHDHHEQQVPDPSTVDLFNAIVDSTNVTTSDSQPNSQNDCGNLNAIQPTVDELLAQTQTHEFQQQLQQEFLQQQNQVQNQNFDLTHFPQTSVPSSMDLLMSDDQMHQTSGGNAIHNSPMSSQMQNNFLKESAEMEQMLGDLTGTDIDLMQVLKCFESTPAGENLGDLAGSLALFNDVDVMNIGLDDVVGTSVPKESRAQDMLAEIEKKREKMIRECDFMMRRLRKIQARHMGRHISEEVGGLYDYTQQLIKRKERETKSISTMTPINQLHSDKHKLNSATSMKMLLKRIEQAATNQQSSSMSGKILMAHANSTTIDHHANNSINLSASGTVGSNASAKPSVITCVPAFDVNGTQQLKQCAGLLSTELSIIQKSIDSDATASSSGGESADEGITYNNQTQQPLSIAKRAAYRWARDRAKIASRWTWLLAQISDLEYRIRQHQELYYLLKKNNGPATFEDDEPMPIVPLDIGSVNGCRNMLHSNIRIPVTAPRLGNMSNTEMKKLDENDDGIIITEETVGSARTRAFKRNAFKKRKLLQSTNLHKISRRAARPCTIKCGCRWPVHPCLLCTGRTDPTAPRDLPDMLSTQEGVALLDPCFHPILSFPEDVAQNIHLEATLRQPEWQARVARVSTKAIIKGALAMQKANERDALRNSTNTSTVTNRKNADQMHPTIKSKKMSQKKFKLGLGKIKSRNKTNNNNTTTIPTERKRRGRKANQPPISGKRRKNKSRKNSHLSATSSDHHDMDIGSPNSSISRSKNPSPTPTGYGYHRLHSNHRNNKNAYDIDNIVIPSNMSTTIEVLSYKEIPTPKWRVIPDKNEAPKIVGEEPTKEEPMQLEEMQLEEMQPVEKEPVENKSEEIQPIEEEPENQSIDEPIDEDISNEAYAQRHERGLNEERRKFLTFLKFPYSTRSRANRRTDSQADSSGANTPDPMSPAPSTPAPATNNEESAPPTPQSVDATAEPTAENGKTINNNTTTTGNGNGIIQKNPLPPISIPKERRRTVSFRKGIDPREELLRRSTTPDVKDTTPPYEPLAFPLPIDTLDQMIQLMPTSYKDIINECIDQVTSHDKMDVNTSDQNPTTKSLVSDIKTPNTTGNFSELSMLAEDSDETESIPDEDPNDPEFEPTPAKRIQKGP